MIFRSVGSGHRKGVKYSLRFKKRIHYIYNMRLFCSTILFPSITAIFLMSCSTGKQLNQSAHKLVLDKEGLREAHVGISIYDADQNKYVYDYQGSKYFVPASNTKLFSLYAAMKYLGDSLTGIRYYETNDSIYLQPAGDPTLLHSDFKRQPVIDWLKKSGKELVISNGNWNEKEWGFGWAWDDFNSGYMAERSSLPVYGNVIKWTQVIEKAEDPEGKMVDEAFVYSEPEVSWKLRFNPKKGNNFEVIRERNDNIFHVTEGKEILRTIEVPFVTNGVLSALDLLRDTVGRSIVFIPAEKSRRPDKFRYSQATDSMLALMMHRSDNLFAEQALLMASQEHIGTMNAEKMIDTLLAADLRDIPQQPRWVDGSGLSRYNQFTPNDFVWLLNKMEKEFSLKRMTAILPGSNDGTLAGYYKELNGSIFAKTGTLSGQVALSGYLTSRKGHHLIFSVLVNNHNTSATTVRRSVEAFIRKVYDLY
jgi:D-alanyl-D-alanine carboxypeptidase/D-alanyl-D-alanine-endopeptidase (penicillin-binding protein 4)